MARKSLKEATDEGLEKPGTIRPQRIAASRHGMIATAHREATRAGVQILADGGNAMDAAVAAAFALRVCEPRRRRGSEQSIREDVLNAFGLCSDIDFAYPTQRFFDNVSEGKEELRPSSAEGQ